MKKLLAIVPALAFALALSVANGEQTKGKIKEINAGESWFTLQDGTRFIVVEGVGVTELDVGDEVTVSYDVKDGRNVAIDVATNKAE